MIMKRAPYLLRHLTIEGVVEILDQAPRALFCLVCQLIEIFRGNPYVLQRVTNVVIIAPYESICSPVMRFFA